MTLSWFDESYWVWRLSAGASVPNDVFCVMRAPDETTVVTTQPAPKHGRSSGPWRLFRIEDELPHDAVGVMAKLSRVLAEAGVPIMPYGSFDTDYVLVPLEKEATARNALAEAGYRHV